MGDMLADLFTKSLQGSPFGRLQFCVEHNHEDTLCCGDSSSKHQNIEPKQQMATKRCARMLIRFCYKDAEFVLNTFGGSYYL